MKSDRGLIFALLGTFAVLMSVPFLVPGTGFIALFAFFPLLAAERIASQSGFRHFFWAQYASFILWNAITTFWVCNATVGGGIFAVFANAIQMALVFEIFRFSKRHLKGSVPYIFLAALWIAFERRYFSVDISWPWLTLGNAFAGSVGCVQWYEYTGTLGGSLWIWACNLGLFGMMCALSDGSWQRFNLKAKTAALSALCLVYLAPPAISAVIYSRYEEKEDPLNVAILQPNIDPYNKFEAMSQAQQDDILLEMAEEASSKVSAPTLYLAPETFTGGVLVQGRGIMPNSTLDRLGGFISQHPGSGIILGASTYEYIPYNKPHSQVARLRQSGNHRYWTESYNSAISLSAAKDSTLSTGLYHKSKLVVGVEMTPYPKVFVPLDDALGGVMGRCIGQPSASILEAAGRKIGCAVCYESVYPEYYSTFAAKGAELMTIITNDAWWGDTPGYRQHLRYACLRAIETRRSIVRCANTGISAIIDQRGRIVESTPWWEKATLTGQVNCSHAQTFFVRNGDIVGRICTLVTLLLAAALIVKLLTNMQHKRK